MANQNLSQFGEKLFVADADHTFIWDTAASISKRVSRNSWLNSGTLTSDAPVTISQTWNGTGSTVFKALVVNATTPGTTSSLTSSLLDLQVGGVSIYQVQKDGRLAFGANGALLIPNLGGAGRWSFGSNSSNGRGLFINPDSFIVNIGSGFQFGWSSSGPGDTAADVTLYRDAANTLALRNGAAAQTFNVYGTSSASNANYARLALTCGLDGNATISTQALGTGTAGTVSINGVPVGLGKGNLSSNIAIGTSAMAARTDGGEATALGSLSLLYATNVSRTTAIGYGAGATLGNGAQNTSSLDSVFIGYDTRSFAINQSNQIVIGNSTTGIGSNSVVLGNDSITKTALKGNVGIGTTAPRTKFHLEDLSVNPNIEISGTTIPNYTGVGFVPQIGSNTITRIGQGSLLNGGLGISGFSAATNGSPAVSIVGYLGPSSPTQPSVAFISYKHDGSTGRAALASTEINSQWLNGTTPLMTLLGGGNVGIGTTSPTSKLHVDGNALFGQNTTSPTLTPIKVSFGGTYGTSTAGSRANLKWEMYNDGIAANTYGIGMSVGVMEFQAGATGGFNFYPNNTTVSALSIASSGAATFAANVFLGGYLQAGAAQAIGFNGRSYLKSPSNGVITLVNTAETDFNRLQLGGTADTFPALKRSTTRIQAVLATTDTTFTNIQGKLTTDTDYTATVVTPTGFLTLYDAQGTAYRVPCVAA